MTPDRPPLFACDAMLGYLARWLRAAGYDTFWREGIDDSELVRLAQQEDRFLLSSDIWDTEPLWERSTTYSKAEPTPGG